MSVAGRVWQVVEIAGDPVEGSRPTVELDREGRAYGSTAVNRWSGAYSLGGDTLTVGPVVATRMAGPEPAMATESAFLAALQQPLRVADDGTERVVLEGPDGQGALVLVEVPPDVGEEAAAPASP